MTDGLLCRTSQDCRWLDPNLQCQDYDIDFSVSRAWLGGSFADIVGECECGAGKVWEDSTLKCEAGGWSGMTIFPVVLLAIVGSSILCVCCVTAWRRIVK